MTRVSFHAARRPPCAALALAHPRLGTLTRVTAAPLDQLVAPDWAVALAPVEPQIRAAGLEAPEKPAQLQYTAPGEDGATQTRVEGRASSRSGNPAKAAAQDAAKRPTKKKRR